ncbi:MAG: hypothetical protein QM737_20100 [Ferruginibacter sp.]
MKTINLPGKKILFKIFFISLFPLNLFSQNLVGMWTGKIFTSEKTLPYEVVISEKDGKLSGYSYTTFNVKGEEMVAMKSIIVKQEKDKIIIEDVDLVFNSFDEESPKQLKQTNIMMLDVVNDKTMIMTGKFETLKTKLYRAMKGNVRLRKDSIVEQPKLVAKLDEMELTKTVSFLAPKEETETLVAKVDKPVTEPEKPKEPEKPVTSPPVAKTTVPVTKPAANPAATKPKPQPPVASNAGAKKPAGGVPVPTVKPPVPTGVIAAIPTPSAPTVAKKTEPSRSPSTPFATKYGDRTLETIQTVVFKSDSITLTLYDNGEVDGDTVSIILNGKTILSKQGLSTNAITKTIQMTPDMGDSLQLIMFAENLGTIAPNTGLLIVKDGRDRYEIRFSGDLNKNAAVILKRRQKEF